MTQIQRRSCRLKHHAWIETSNPCMVTSETSEKQSFQTWRNLISMHKTPSNDPHVFIVRRVSLFGHASHLQQSVLLLRNAVGSLFSALQTTTLSQKLPSKGSCCVCLPQLLKRLMLLLSHESPAVRRATAPLLPLLLRPAVLLELYGTGQIQLKCAMGWMQNLWRVVGSALTSQLPALLPHTCDPSLFLGTSLR